jgi:N-ethylmaleimide reductase
MMTDTSPLFRPLQAGDIPLSNRIVMAPLTRNRAAPGLTRRARSTSNIIGSAPRPV